MIVRDFLRRIETASPGERAEAAEDLARTYLHGDLKARARAEVESALTVLLDDPAPLVRRSLAQALSGSTKAPRNVILGLAADGGEIAAEVLSRSPVLKDGELVDLVAGMSGPVQVAIAVRPFVSTGLSAAIVELGCVEACQTLVANDGAEIARISLDRLVERYGSDAEIRGRLLARPDLPLPVRQSLVRHLSAALGELVAGRGWLAPERADDVLRDACDRATVAIADESQAKEHRALAEHLRLSGQLTTSLLLRSVCAGNLGFFAAALSVLSRMPESRVRALVFDRRAAPLRAVYRRAGLPAVAFDAFSAAVRTCRHWQGEKVDPAMRARYTRRMVDEVLARYEASTDSELNELLTMLRRFAADAGRAAAREFAVAEVEAA